MANRIVGNAYIIDTVAATTDLTWPAAGLLVQTIAFWASDSNGKLELTYSSNSNNTAVIISNPNTFAGTNTIGFDTPQKFDEPLRVKTCTNGTAWLYFV